MTCTSRYDLTEIPFGKFRENPLNSKKKPCDHL